MVVVPRVDLEEAARLVDANGPAHSAKSPTTIVNFKRSNAPLPVALPRTAALAKGTAPRETAQLPILEREYRAHTMPGFTETSVFGSLFAASGAPYPELLDRLVGLALQRFEAERAHRY
jgi:hypothetical protein